MLKCITCCLFARAVVKGTFKACDELEANIKLQTRPSEIQSKLSLVFCYWDIFGGAKAAFAVCS